MFFCWCRVAVLWTWAAGLLLIDHGQLDLFLVWIHVARFVMNRYAKSMRSVSKCVVILLFFHLFSYGCYIWIIGCTKPALPALGEASSDSPPEPAECIKIYECFKFRYQGQCIGSTNILPAVVATLLMTTKSSSHLRRTLKHVESTGYHGVKCLKSGGCVEIRTWHGFQLHLVSTHSMWRVLNGFWFWEIESFGYDHLHSSLLAPNIPRPLSIWAFE